MPLKIKEREYRNLINFRALENEDNKENSYIVEGYAAIFDEPYTLYEDEFITITEIVDKEAFKSVDLNDVILQYDHQGRVFARTSNNTLRLTTDDVGLRIRAYLGGTEIGKDLYEEIKGRYTTKMSWGFSLDDSKDIERIESYNDKNDTYEVTRIIKNVKKIYDVSAVSLPANNATEISARSVAEGVAAEAKAERLERLNIDKLKLKILLEMEG